MALDRRLSADLTDSINERGAFKGDSMRHGTAPKVVVNEHDTKSRDPMDVDVVCIGAGVMSATVGLMLKELEPSWRIVMYERLHEVAIESSNGFNNAGTGHSGFMEPNYTKEVFENGVLKTVTTEKVESVCTHFLSSRQYWEYLRKKELLPDPDTFIHQTDHIALGIGKDQVAFIQKRYEAMSKLPLFRSMELAGPDEKKKQAEWAPLITQGRDPNQPICMSRVSLGTDVDYGALTKGKVNSFMKLGGDLRLFTEVTGLRRDRDGKSWLVSSKHASTGRGRHTVRAKFVFVGAGGWALLMLQKAGIKQVKGYMALPVTGDWAVCQNPDVVRRHKVKVYAPGAPGAPPMSMPHLDYRTIGGKEMLLFGPFGSITLKFLRYGRATDALRALKCHNICSTVGALSRNLGLAVMLMKDVFKSGRGKLRDIRHYYPEADAEDWTLIPAGVRAQIIKRDAKTGKGMLQFGTEVVANDEGTIVGLLGASPGASTCVTIALDTLEKCFKDKPEFKKWEPQIKKMIPSWEPEDHSKLTEASIQQIYKSTATTLKINKK